VRQAGLSTALVRAVNVGLHRAASHALPLSSARCRRTLPSRRRRRRCRWILAAAFPDQRVGAGEEIRMILDELAQAVSMRSSSPSAMKIRLTGIVR